MSMLNAPEIFDVNLVVRFSRIIKPCREGTFLKTFYLHVLASVVKTVSLLHQRIIHWSNYSAIEVFLVSEYFVLLILKYLVGKLTLERYSIF